MSQNNTLKIPVCNGLSQDPVLIRGATIFGTQAAADRL